MTNGKTIPMTGTVKWFDCKRGFGFLVTGDGPDIFVHHSAIEGEGFKRLRDGELVEFELAAGPRGPAAIRVRKLTPTPSPAEPSPAEPSSGSPTS